MARRQACTVPLPLRRSSISGRAILDRATIHHDDVVPLLDSEYPDALNARRLGLRAVLAVPLIREGNAYGAIFLWRREPGLFSPEQVALVQTFAQQAAIAVDNVRLFNETKEALEQQTSIQRNSAASQFDCGHNPVLDNPCKLRAPVRGQGCLGNLVGDDGLIRIAHSATPLDKVKDIAFGPVVSGETATANAIIQREVQHLPDVLNGQDVPAGTRRSCEAVGTRAVIVAPMMREVRAIGSIAVGRITSAPSPTRR